MLREWLRVDAIDGYERTYQSGSFRVAYEAMAPGLKYLRRDLFVDGIKAPIPLPPVYVEGLESLRDEFYEGCLRAAHWHIAAAIEKL
jgi:hypothetical protein